VLSDLSQAGPFYRDAFRRLWWSKPFSLSAQEFVRNNPDKGALHQGTALAHPDDLFPRDGIHEFQKIPVKIRITCLAEHPRAEGRVCQ